MVVAIDGAAIPAGNMPARVSGKICGWENQQCMCGSHMGPPPSQDGVGTDSMVHPGGQHTWPGYRLKNAPPPTDRLSSHFVAHHVKFVVWTCERQQQSHPQSAMACEDKAAMASTELLHAIPGHTSKLALRRGRSGRSCGARGRALTCQSPHSCVRTQYENCLTIKSTIAGEKTNYGKNISENKRLLH